MRALALVAVITLAAPAAADPIPAPPPARGTTLVKADAAWRWQIVTVPRIAPRIGAHAVSVLDVAAGLRPEPIAVLGEEQAAPGTWPFDVDGDRKAIGEPAAGERIAAAFGVTTFSISDDALEMLELRLHYQDAVAVWLNGIEVVRQGLPRGSSVALAHRPRGPEWETFYIPIAPGLVRRGPNTLAVEVHPSGRRVAPSLAADLVGRRDRGIVRGPILADTSQTSATILVETDPNVEVVLEWGAGDASDRKQTSRGRRHRFEITGLTASTRYGYRVVAGASRTSRFAFQTLPGANAVMRIGVYGDVRGGHAVHRRLVEHMLAEGLDAVGVTGDMVLRGSDQADWQRFFAVTGELLAQVPYLPAVGNHDLGWDGAEGKADAGAGTMFALPPGPPGRPAGTYWYSRAVADLHFVFLDSNSYERTEQEVWLEADLAAARKRGVRAILVFTHDGPFARGYHGGNLRARERYVPILARHRIDFLFSGHDHLYQRGEAGGIKYMLAGGGGAPLYNIRCGVTGRPACKVDDGMQAIAKEHHYAVVTIGKDLELCTRRPDGKLLEKCVRYPLRK